MLNDKKINAICISWITVLFEEDCERYSIKSFICQRDSNDVFKIMHQEKKEFTDENDEDNYAFQDMTSIDYVNPLLDHWILEKTTELDSRDELISFLLLAGFDQGSIDTLTSFTVHELDDIKLEILSFVKPV